MKGAEGSVAERVAGRCQHRHAADVQFDQDTRRSAVEVVGERGMWPRVAGHTRTCGAGHTRTSHSRRGHTQE